MTILDLMQIPQTTRAADTAGADAVQDTLTEVVDTVAVDTVGGAWSGFIDGPALATDLVQVALVILLSLAAYRGLQYLTARLQKEVEEDDLVRKRHREQRSQTVASLLNNIGAIAIALIAALTIISTFVPIGPLLAGVGVLGLALSFGAQSLVKDLIAGIFMLAEGQFAVGDVVRVRDTAGLVEKITLRTTVLRDINGVAHVIPNGTIEMLSNLTKSWSRAVLEIGVAYKEDVDRVMEVMLDEAEALSRDKEWAPLITEEPTVPGVERFDDSAVVIRVMFRTLPLKQWDVAREYRRRIKSRFDAEDIEFPFPHRMLYWGEDEDPRLAELVADEPTGSE